MAAATANKVSVQLLLGALLFAMLFAAAKATPLCKIDTKDFDVCRSAVNPEHGQPLPLPTDSCCTLVRRADLKCLCNLRSLLPALGINTANAMALPSKCGLETPSECHGQ